MCRPQFVLALMALYVGLAHSWEIAVSVGDQLIFYTNGAVTNTVNLTDHKPAALAYDEVHNTMIYVDRQSDNNAICSYNLLSKENKCFIRKVGAKIHAIALDPATNKLFFTDTNERSINWISLKAGANNNINNVVTMTDRTPTDIALDICRGYIYWVNTNVTDLHHMYRARLDSSKIEVIYGLLPIFTMSMDLQSRQIYQFDGLQNQFLVSTDFDGRHENIILDDVYLSEPKELTISNDSLYWMNSSMSYATVWQKSKNPMDSIDPIVISRFYSERPRGIVANYKIRDQMLGLQDCDVLKRLIPKTSETDNSLSVQQTTETVHTTAKEMLAVHGTKLSESSATCAPGYIGGRCDVSICENYCLQGNCSFNDEGLRTCRCNAGYSGERCEVYTCTGYCLNNGDCSINENSEPVCRCRRDYLGDRCEVSDCLNYCVQGECSFNEEGIPSCRCNAGYSGERCEVYACHAFCLNHGVCSLNEEEEPVCQCDDYHEGTRCEAVIDDPSLMALLKYELGI